MSKSARSQKKCGFGHLVRAGGAGGGFGGGGAGLLSGGGEELEQEQALRQSQKEVALLKTKLKEITRASSRSKASRTARSGSTTERSHFIYTEL